MDSLSVAEGDHRKFETWLSSGSTSGRSNRTSGFCEGLYMKLSTALALAVPIVAATLGGASPSAADEAVPPVGKSL